MPSGRPTRPAKARDMTATKRQRVTMIALSGLLAIGGVAASALPAAALGSITSGNYHGHSFLTPSNNWLRVQTAYSVTGASVRVCAQGTAAGNLITGVPRVCGNTAFAQWTGTSGYQAPGGRHWKADGTTFNT